MEQTTLPALTGLDNMPRALQANVSLADRAIANVRPQIEPMKAIDLATVDAQLMEANDEQLATLQVKLKDSYTLMNDRRKPFTQRMDEIKALFTAEEKKIAAISDEVKAIRDDWAREKGRRQQLSEQEKQEKVKIQQAFIEARAFIQKHIVDRFSTAAVVAIQRMHSKFYDQAAGQLDAYCNTLKAWNGLMPPETWNGFLEGIVNVKPQFITGEKLQQILDEVVAEQKPKLSKEWQDRMIQERDQLVELKDSRLMELERIAGDAAAAKEAEDRIAREKAERDEQARKDAQDRAQAIEQNSQVDQVNSAFEVASQAVPMVGMTKGTVVKKKYQPKSHKAHLAIVQYWVTNCMPLMTLEELQTKLSFMRTAADKALNEGRTIEAEGLEVVEDYSTRTSRRKEAVA